MLRVTLLAVVALQVGCASHGTWVAHCVADEELRTTPSLACLEQPQSREVTSYLSRVIDAAAGPFAVLVGFDEASRVGSVCTVRNPTPRQWEAQKTLNDRYPEILDAPAGPACLAITTILVNRKGAELGSLKQVLFNCRADESGGTNQLDRICMLRRQAQRGELWFFNSHHTYPYVFVPVGEGAAQSGQALDRCTDSQETKPVQLPEIKIGYTYSHRRLSECMEALGWKQTI